MSVIPIDDAGYGLPDFHADDFAVQIDFDHPRLRSCCVAQPPLFFVPQSAVTPTTATGRTLRHLVDADFFGTAVLFTGNLQFVDEYRDAVAK